jgi:heat shock protein HslJ
VAIDWTVVGDIANVRILRGDLVLLDGGANTGSGSDCLRDVGEYTYRLEATDTAGLTSSAEATVTAGAAAGAAPDALSGSYMVATFRNAAGEQVSPIATTQITADFSNGAVSGNGGCNVYSGSYTAAEGAITVSPLAVTMMFCVEPEGISEQEAAYLAALQSASLYTLDGSQLTLSDAEGAPLVVYVAQ